MANKMVIPIFGNFVTQLILGTLGVKIGVKKIKCPSPYKWWPKCVNFHIMVFHTSNSMVLSMFDKFRLLIHFGDQKGEKGPTDDDPSMQISPHICYLAEGIWNWHPCWKISICAFWLTLGVTMGVKMVVKRVSMYPPPIFNPF